MDILERVKKNVAEELGIDWRSNNQDDDIEKELGADSLHMVQIVMAAENEFDIAVTDEEAAELKTIRQIAGFVEARIVKETVVV